jgi:hypothetical protein
MPSGAQEAFGQVAEIGKLGREVAVDENQLAGSTGDTIGRDLRGRNREFALGCAAEGSFCEGR